MQETGVQSLSQEDPLEKGVVAHSSILAWKSREQRGMVGYSPRDCKRVGCGLVAKQKQNKVRMTFLNGGGGGGISTRLILW